MDLAFRSVLIPILAENGPCLSSSIDTVEDASYNTTILKVYSSGSIASQHPLPPHYPLGHRLPTNLHRHRGVGSNENQRRNDGLLQVLIWTSVRLSVQFLDGDTPRAELAVWACIVSRGTMQHPVALGHDSWIRFEQRTCSTLSGQPFQSTFGNFSLCTSMPTVFPRSSGTTDSAPVTSQPYRLSPILAKQIGAMLDQ